LNSRSGLLAGGALRPESTTQDPLALETTVIATGARPGDSTTKRELFIEETQTVLVFEQGAVIRLSAAVADGQLLFLSNKATGKEVVTQVLRTRSFRATNSYVDLEFTEPCPGFWGIEFAKVEKTAKVPGADRARNKPGDEDSGKGDDQAALPRSPQEVQSLKAEVAGLQTQLQSLLQRDENVALKKTAGQEVKSNPELLRKKEEEHLEELFALETKQEQSNLPKRLVAYPQKSVQQTLQRPAVRRSLIAALVLALASAGAYWFGAFDAVTKKMVAAKATPGHAMPATVPTAQKPVLPNGVPGPYKDGAKNTSARPETEPTNPAANPVSAAATGDKSSVGVLGLPLNSTLPSLVKSSSQESLGGKGIVATRDAKDQRGAEIDKKMAGPAKNDRTVSNPKSESELTGGAGVISDGDGYVGPKLVHGAKPVAPAEAVKNYVTGNVNLDALVDAAGHVKSVTVISGPEKLRETAIEDMKQYVYEPAKKNGKAVPAHVQVSLQFWYEP
jgi:hypothetical protein